MSDGRSDIVVEVLLCHFEQAKEIISKEQDIDREYVEDVAGYPAIGAIHIYEQYDGYLNSKRALVEAGIPFFHRWEADDYPAGATISYYTEDGRHFFRDYTEDDLLIGLTDLQIMLAKPDPLKLLKEKVSLMEQYCEPMDWEFQEEYSKRYLVNKLLGA